MRIERIALKGFMCFPAPVELDLRDLPAGLIALCGPNGAGKTTLLEAPLAAIYRQWMSRDGELVDYATGADSFLDVELSVDGRGAYRSRVSVDGVKRSSAAVLEAVQADGRRTVLNDGKVSTFAAVVGEHFPPKELLLASAFAAQNKAGSFVSLGKKERKDLFAIFLGLERYQTMSDTARQAASFVDQARTRLIAQRDVLARDTAAGILADLERVADELQATGGHAEMRLTELQATLTDLEARLAAVQDTVARHLAATGHVRTLEGDLAGRRAERATWLADASRAAADWTAERQRLANRRATDIADIANRLAGNEKILEQAEAIRKAVAAIAVIDHTLTTVRTALDDNLRRTQTAHDAVLAAEKPLEHVLDTKERLAQVERDAALLGTVPCGGSGVFASCQFLTNARAAYERMPDLAAIVETEPDLRAAVAERSKSWEANERAAVESRERIESLERDRTRLMALAKYAESLAAAEARIAELTQQRAQIERDSDERLAQGHARAEARAAELTEQGTRLDTTIASRQADLVTAQADVAATADGHQQALGLQAQIAEARADRDEVTRTLARVDAGRAELARRRNELTAKRARLVDITSRLTRLDAELLDWQFLSKAFGREGLPVLEIDAAGPTISAYTNDLLAVCFGTRFSVELVTQRAKADGKGFVDDFSVHVLDNERGGEPRDIGDLSGGEQVIVAEALMNAIAVYVNTRSEMPVRTCWRDETTGALDPENAQRYLAMLRKVQELGGFWHVMFITHNPDAAAQADAQIQVHDGTVSIALPPYQQQEAA